MISKEKFKLFVDELTNEDNEMIKKETSSSSGSSVGIGITFLIIGFVTFFSVGMIFFVLGIILLASSAAASYKKEAKKREYRDKYIDKVLNCLLEGYEYTFDREDKIEESIFDSSQFAYDYDIYKGSDKLSINIPNDDGSPSSTYLTLCDLEVEKIEYREVDDSFGSNQNDFNKSFHHTRKE